MKRHRAAARWTIELSFKDSRLTGRVTLTLQDPRASESDDQQ